jgi:hypothetical protein
MTTRTVTGSLPQYIGSTITFRNLDPIISGGATYPPKDTSPTIGGGGAFSTSLIVPDAGSTRYAVTLPSEAGRPNPRILVNIAAGAATSLESLIALAGVEADEQSDLDTLFGIEEVARLAGDATNATAITTEAATRAAADTEAATRLSDLERHVTAQTLTDAASIAWDTSAGHLASVTLGGNRTLAAPTNGVAGTYILRVTQDGTGSRALAYDAVFEWAGGTAPVLSTAAGAVDVLSFVSFDGAAFQGSLIKNFT